MMALGTRQLETLRGVGTMGALIVGTPRTRRLVELGLMASEPNGSFARITPDGLRALADAVDAGRIDLFVMPGKEGSPHA